jgi:hypothetical protein
MWIHVCEFITQIIFSSIVHKGYFHGHDTIYHARCNAAIPILYCIEYKLKGNHTQLCGKELEVLLKQKGAAVSKMKTVLDKRTLFQKFVDNGAIGLEDKSSILAHWMDTNEARLVALKNAPIELADTTCGRHEVKKKKDLVWAIKKMTPEERAAILQQMAEMDTANAANNKTVPPSLTPI